ncbi:cation:proton antiporter [Rubrobacter taiwanensis]|uniref:Cation:proton antiporter n=1 Tax=Rubrobacter taiwanensis TaxID=185139 RepID=A0A4R1BQG3_9ACTN|nr:cation:proton antiporter [Rubrobacter taiwanensis]TCJ19944.1 cation:proton antiporter [Rubrobacter taiwanensis]
MENIYLVAAIWVGLALLASLISIRLGISVALIEITVGILAGNLFDVPEPEWVAFLAGVGAVALTFLAGVDIDTEVLRNKLAETLLIGSLSFLIPFLGAAAWAYWISGWDTNAALIAGIALSTTSVAVVYAVMVETGLNRSEIGKVILAACFVTDLGTVAALGLIFAGFGVEMLVFIAATAAVLVVLPRFTRWFFRRYGERVSEPELKYLLLMLFGLGALASLAGSEAVLPAYLAGLVLADTFQSREELAKRMRTLTFTFLTPFYFIRAGLFVSFGALVAGFWAILVFFFVKVAAKFIGVMPVTLFYGYSFRNSMYTTLLMSTGLTFGTISALYGLDNGLITQQQYSVLVTVVIATAVIPTLIAQRFFLPFEEIKKLRAAKEERE